MPSLSKVEELKLISKIQSISNPADKERQRLQMKLLDDNTVVNYYARKYSRGDLDLYKDLVQEGTLGFFHAIDKFEKDKNTRLSTYASWWVRQFIQQHMNENGRTIRVPVHISDQASKAYRAKSELSAILGREPTNQEVADHLQITDDQLRHAETSVQNLASLHFKISEDTDLGDVIEDEENQTPDQIYDDIERKNIIADVLKNLTPREERVLRLRFGIDSTDEHTLEEISVKMNLTKERIRQIQNKALEKLASKENCEILKMLK